MPTKKRLTIPVDIKMTVLHEAGYKCANPVCRHVLTLDIHHLEYVSEGGVNTAENLLPLCPNCHSLHHRKEIPHESIRAWKMLLLALNEAFDRRSVDILLLLDKQQVLRKLSGDGVIELAALVASGYVQVEQYWDRASISGMSPGQHSEQMFEAKLTERGTLLVHRWKHGDQAGAIGNTPSAQAL